MYELHLHKQALKSLQKASRRIREKANECILHLKNHGTQNCPYPVATLQGKFKRFHYLEAKIDKDYRIIFRTEGKNLYIRAAGTHNKLGTG